MGQVLHGSATTTEVIRRAIQLMFSAPWQIPTSALETDAVKADAQEIAARRSKFYRRFQEDKSIKLPGFWAEGCTMSRDHP